MGQPVHDGHNLYLHHHDAFYVSFLTNGNSNRDDHEFWISASFINFRNVRFPFLRNAFVPVTKTEVLSDCISGYRCLGLEYAAGVGEEDAVGQMIEACRRGPPLARVDQIDVDPVDLDILPEGFTQLPTA